MFFILSIMLLIFYIREKFNMKNPNNQNKQNQK